MSALSLENAERHARAALAEARRRSLNRLSVAVIDASGNLKVALREDGAGVYGVDIALGKARAALGFGCTSGQIADALAGNPLAGPSVLAVLQGRVVLLPGGVLIQDAGGTVIGAIGAAGDAPANDEAAARAGLAA
jgi:uncharacterized protein GlcG (DUF336 family)